MKEALEWVLCWASALRVALGERGWGQRDPPNKALPGSEARPVGHSGRVRVWPPG